jgi:hypothetical protein
MERVTLNADLSNQLCSSPLPVELCDAGGHSLGFFVPSKAAYAAIKLPIGEDELAARGRSTNARTWKEIRADLEQKYGIAQS